MEETKTGTELNQEKEPTTNPEESGKVFTQDQLNAIIADRLMREREKYADYNTLKEKAGKLDQIEEANKTELEKATEKAATLQAQIDAMTKANNLRELRAKISTETGVPASLLSGEDEETCRTQAKAILGFKLGTNVSVYPEVKDAGEKPHGTVSKESILAIKDNKERLKAIQENIDLFK